MIPATELDNEVVIEKQVFTAEQKKELAYLESYIVSMKNQLCDVIQDSMNQVRKKQTRTIEETLAEKNYAQEQVEDDESSESDENDLVYNPKNLPLGWDGK